MRRIILILVSLVLGIISCCALFACDVESEQEPPKPTVYTITYNLDGGDTLPSDAIRTYRLSDTAITLPVATKTGCEFKGWINGTEVITEIAAGTTGNLVLTAKWQEKEICFTVVLQNTTNAGFTKWADGTVGDKTVLVQIGEKLTIPPIVYDTLSETAKNNDDYAFRGWFYRDKNGTEHKLDLSVDFTFENLNVETFNLTVYARVYKQWAGPY